LEEQFSFIKGQALTQIWAYNFDNMDDVEWERKSSSNNSVGRDVSKRGIGLHCDFARVSINIWITPDDANLDPNSGGLIVYKLKAGNITFNDAQSEAFGAEFLESHRHNNVTVSYKQNRAVIFKSDLWHQTDRYSFKKGHKNRRINLTFLFGSPQEIYHKRADNFIDVLKNGYL
jgi:hypothetical protein